MVDKIEAVTRHDLIHELPKAGRKLEAVAERLKSIELVKGNEHDDNQLQREIGVELAATREALDKVSEFTSNIKRNWAEDTAHDSDLRRVAAALCEPIDNTLDKVRPEKSGGSVLEDNVHELAHKARNAMKELFSLVA